MRSDLLVRAVLSVVEISNFVTGLVKLGDGSFESVVDGSRDVLVHFLDNR